MADDSSPVAKKARTETTAAEGDAPATVLLGGVRVCAVGLGTLPAGVAYPAPALRPNSAALQALVAAAARQAAPATLFLDTADVYCEPHTDVHGLERDLFACIAAENAGKSGDARLDVALTTKSGMRRISSESNGWRPAPSATTAAGVRASIEAAREALCAPGEPLLLWSLHHCDGVTAPDALEACLRAAAACVKEGLLKHVGLSNATVPLLRRALAVTPIAAVQNEWGPYQREAERALPATAAASSKKGVIAFCAQHDILFVAYAPLGGLKARRAERVLARDHPGCAVVAARRGCSAHAACLAAMLARGAALGARVLLIPGARTAEHAADSVAAAKLRLTDADVAAIMPHIA
jgi:aryl-alcohol dehydrogenase-like predicted oxidoreductase